MSREDEYQLVETCRHLSRIGMLPASDGSCSIRLSESRALITPKGSRKEQLKPRDLVQMNLDSDTELRKASKEWRIHAAIYNTFSEVAAIVHAHPAYLTAAGLKGEAPDADLLTETQDTVGEITLISSGEPESDAYAQEVASDIEGSAVAILEKHGAIALGGSIQEAQFRLERSEYLAKVSLYAQ